MFAKFTSAFSDVSDMDEFVKTGNFWALMFFILALGVLVAYGILGATFTRLQHVCFVLHSLHTNIVLT